MGLLIVLVILALIFVGVGFTIHLLWIAAVVAALLFLISLFVRGTSRSRWW